MKAIRIICSIFNIVTSLFLSLILAGLLMLTPLISTLSSFFCADTLHNIINTIDVSEFTGNLDLPETIEVNGILLTIPYELLDSDLADGIIALYFDSLFATFEGKDPQEVLSVTTVKELTNQHMNELTQILKENLGSDLPLTDEMIQSLIDSSIESLVPALLSTLPTYEELGIHSGTITTLQKLYRGTYLTYALVAIVFLSLLICVLRYRRLQGFLWLGVVYLSNALLSIPIGLLCGTGETLLLRFTDSTIIRLFMNPLLSLLTDAIMKGVWITALLGILFILICTILRKCVQKKKEVSKLAA